MSQFTKDIAIALNDANTSHTIEIHPYAQASIQLEWTATGWLHVEGSVDGVTYEELGTRQVPIVMAGTGGVLIFVQKVVPKYLRLRYVAGAVGGSISGKIFVTRSVIYG